MAFADAKKETPEDDDFLEKPKKEWQYGTLRPANKPVGRLLINKGGEWRGYKYSHLDSDSVLRPHEKGQEIIIGFVGTRPTQITIRGRNLLRMFDYIMQCRWNYLWEAGKDDAKDGELIVLEIEIEPYGDPEIGAT